MDVAVHVVGCETYHDAARVGPRLAAEVAYIVDIHSYFLLHLSSHTLLQCLACLYKSCHEAVHLPSAEVERMNHQYLVPLPYAHDDGRAYLGPYLFAAVGASLADVGMALHWCSAHTAVSRVAVPVKEFVGLGCHLVEVFVEQMPRLPQAYCLKAFHVGRGHTDAVCHAGLSTEGRKRLTGCPILQGQRRVGRTGDVVAVLVVKKKNIVCNEHKPIGVRCCHCSEVSFVL